MAIKYNTLSTLGKQMRLPYPTGAATDLKNSALLLLDQLWKEGSSFPVRAITVTAIQLIESGDYIPSTLFAEEQISDKRTRLEKSIDGIREKFGYGSITRGALLAENEKEQEEYDEEGKPFKRQ